jgi:hypothetical protein
MAWPIFYFTKLASGASKHSTLIAALVAFFLWITDVITNTIVAVLEQIAALIISLDVSSFQDVSLASIEYIGYINAFFPVSEFVVLVTLYTVAWVTVILIRWIKSFVPTVAN